MNVNMNVMTNTTSKKQESPKPSNRSEDFKSVLDNHELKSGTSSTDVQKKDNKDQNDNKVNKQSLDKANSRNPSDEVENKDNLKNTAQVSIQTDSKTSEGNVDLKSKVISLVEEAIAKLKKTLEGPSVDIQGEDKPNSEMAELQQLLQLLNSMFHNEPEVPTNLNGEGEPNSINLESVVVGKKLTPDASGMLKNNLSEIIAMLKNSKGNDLRPFEIKDMLQKLTTVVDELKGDMSLIKVPNLQNINVNIEDKSIKENLIKKLMEQNTKGTSETTPSALLQSSNDLSKESKFSGNSSSEEKFLNNLLGKDKDEMKISKAVNFMNQFETVKTVDTAKVQTITSIIDKNSFTVDVIKNIKFMEINNLKDLTVKMNPKELGEITIKLTMESGIMKASISAQNKETFNLLNQNLQDISDKLKNMDIKIQSLDINIYEDSTFFNKDSSQRNNGGNKNSNTRTNIGLEEEDMSISNNFVIEENQVNKFV